MTDVIAGIEFLNIPTAIAIAVVGVLLILQIVGELLELKGKIVPEFMKIRKIFIRRKQERIETAQMLREVRQLLSDVNEHYSADNITRRDSWMQWVNDRAVVYDSAITELTDLKTALHANNELTLDLYININRNRIIDFASKIANESVSVSREEFNRIFKIYDDYERTLETHGKTNGEVDIAYRIIQESYEQHLRDHSFIEDIRGY